MSCGDAGGVIGAGEGGGMDRVGLLSRQRKEWFVLPRQKRVVFFLPRQESGVKQRLRHVLVR